MVVVQNLLLGRDVAHIGDANQPRTKYRVMATVYDERQSRFMVCVVDLENGSMATWPVSDARLLPSDEDTRPLMYRRSGS